MIKSVSFNKREIEKKKQSKKLEKQNRKDERKANKSKGSLESMIAYVDENGNLTDKPPDPASRQEIDAESIKVSTPKQKEDENSRSSSGEVDYFNERKGFGFIKDSKNGESHFFHISNAVDDIKEGDKVNFELRRGNTGMDAIKITLVKQSDQ